MLPSRLFQISGSQGILVPVGLIILLNEATVPTGWDLYSPLAENRFIVGSEGSYAIGDSGGSLTVGNVTSGSAGAHSHANLGGTCELTWTSTSRKVMRTDVAGAHTHAITSLSHTPAKEDLRIIKANQASPFLPPNAVMLADRAVSGFDVFGTSGRWIGYSSVIASQAAYNNGSVGVGGSHYHGGPQSVLLGPPYVTGSDPYGAQEIGGHSSGVYGHPSFTLTPTYSLYLAALRAYTKTSASKIQSGFIAMWDQAGVPSGWLLCDGLDDVTPDLRDCFIKVDPSGDGTISGAGLSGVSLAGYLDYNTAWGPYHNHYVLAMEGPNARKTGSDPYASNMADFTHRHTISLSNASWIPPYYALKFIQYIG